MTNDSPLAAAPRRRGLLQLLTGSAVLLGGALLWQGSDLQAAEQAVRIPPPAQDMPATGQGPQKARNSGQKYIWPVIPSIDYQRNMMLFSIARSLVSQVISW